MSLGLKFDFWPVSYYLVPNHSSGVDKVRVCVASGEHIHVDLTAAQVIPCLQQDERTPETGVRRNVWPDTPDIPITPTRNLV